MRGEDQTENRWKNNVTTGSKGLMAEPTETKEVTWMLMASVGHLSLSWALSLISGDIYIERERYIGRHMEI